MRGVLRAAFALWALLVAVVSAMFVGTTMVLPFALLRRGRRERYTISTAAMWARFMTDGVLRARVRVTGRQAAPGDEGALVICNHRSWLDPLLLVGRTRAQGLSKAEILFIPFVGVYAWLTGAVFFHRRSFKQRKRARAECMDLLRSGARLHVFPEGTRTRDGRLATKVFLTLPKDCFAAGLPVIPCAVMGSERALPVGVGAWPGAEVRLDIGEPLYPRDYADADAFAQACWAEVVRRVAALEDEERSTASVA